MSFPLLSPTRGVNNDSTGCPKPTAFSLAIRHSTAESQPSSRQNTQQLSEPQAPRKVTTSNLDGEYLRRQARWIRDVLDPQVAQDGPDALHSDEILTLDELLRELIGSSITVEDVRYSRMHLVVSYVAGKATRWPKKLIDRCEELKVAWEAKYGNLKSLGTPLYEAGGRLYGICKPEDMNREKLLVKWLKSPGAVLSPAVSRRTGDLGFTAGEYINRCFRHHEEHTADGPRSWWINPLFAHRAGIIDMSGNEGGIVCDSNAAYAVVMTGDDEIAGNAPEIFQYRCRDVNLGRYRLTAGTPDSRQPIRILRSHSLQSVWKPRVGLRYDGLHRVTGWTIKQDNKTGNVVYVVTFRRIPCDISMETVLKRPWSDEVEDYMEYKRIRPVHRKKHKDSMQPSLGVSTDGTVDSDGEDNCSCISVEDLEERVEIQKQLQRWKWKPDEEVEHRRARDSLADVSPGDLKDARKRERSQTVVWRGSEKSSKE